MRTNVFRRMHRKIVVIDARIAFIGGLNYSAEHMSSYGPEAKQDYAVRLEGPMSKIFSSLSWKTSLDRARHDAGGDVITKRKKIASREKRRYCWSGAITKNTAMIRTPLSENAHSGAAGSHYRQRLLLPGYRFLHALRKAARRGVIN